MNPSKKFEFMNHDTRNLFPIGLSTFDNLVGGGFPASSVNLIGKLVWIHFCKVYNSFFLLIDEDYYQQYSTMLTKAFICNGIVKDETILIFSEDLLDRNNRFFRELPTIQ